MARDPSGRLIARRIIEHPFYFVNGCRLRQRSNRLLGEQLVVRLHLVQQPVVGARIGQRLVEAREQAQREATRGRDSRTGTAIALRDKDIELKDFYRESSQARGTWRAVSATAGYSSAARRAGDKAGRRARLGSSPELAGARSAVEK